MSDQPVIPDFMKGMTPEQAREFAAKFNAYVPMIAAITWKLGKSAGDQTEAWVGFDESGIEAGWVCRYKDDPIQVAFHGSHSMRCDGIDAGKKWVETRQALAKKEAANG